MPAPCTVALDAMGGDYGPEVVIPGAALSLTRHPNLNLIFYGDEARMAPLLAAHPELAGKSRLVHADVAISMNEKPSAAVRRGRKSSSMWLALKAVKDGQAQVAVSAGNTGALMAMTKLCLKTISGIDRPALAALWPTVRSECIVLDVGANVGTRARGLADNALMGAAMARAIFHIEKPTVGLLNIGVEEIKGVDEVKQAHVWLKQSGLPIDYRGFIEGDQIGQGVVDVVVVEGFAGNIALKTAEGTAKQMASYVKMAMSRSWVSRLGAFIAQGAFRALQEKLDPGRSNGGTFLGVNGISVKSHGGADARGFAAAVDLGYEMSEAGLIGRLDEDLQALRGALEQAAAADVFS